ncbi:hypothetical protein T484DRAFT_1817200 [Baffinella frigidus]|nr:hypothetical protein T484DRAFT_1817200 [Cryptophyta sp. CCMP2293]
MVTVPPEWSLWVKGEKPTAEEIEMTRVRAAVTLEKARLIDIEDRAARRG